LEKVFNHHLTLAEQSGIKKTLVASIQLGCLYFIAYSANALAFWQGSREIAASVARSGSNTSVGAVYTVIFLLVDSSFIISQVAPFLQLFSSAAGAFEKLVETMHRVSTIDGTAPTGQILPAILGEIEFRNVSFTYPSRSGAEVLKSISLRIPANKRTAVVGLSGSGKSTVAALIQRLYDPDSGEIFIDGHDARELNVKSIRGFVGTMAQNSTLFDRSILENIAYGLVNSPHDKHVHLKQALLDSSLPDLAESVPKGRSLAEAIEASTDDVKQIIQLVREAATNADAINFIDGLQHGLATNSGPGGSQLSGGQKQRVALARALVRQPSIWLLDEATASLDSVSERLIQAGLDRVTEGRTSISIAHRLGTVKNAENIIVMGAGEILEQGTYVELLARDGVFAGMVRLQSLDKSSPAQNPALARLAENESPATIAQHDLQDDDELS
jgi:ATP-binding cassette subfamily B (MDR/TAP) protein 1